VILITHDLGVVAGMTDRIVVMYAGRVFESATTSDLVRAAGQSLHARLAAVGAEPDARIGQGPVPDSWSAPGCRTPSARLSVRASMRPGRGHLPA
jgi:ABC-type glutathione transport system ATPase component